MDFIKSKLSSIGGFMVLAGIASILLHFFDYELRILKWIDLWGTTIGWVIRIGLIVGGGLLFMVAPSAEDESVDEGTE